MNNMENMIGSKDIPHFFVDKSNYKIAYKQIRRFAAQSMVVVHIPYYSKKNNVDSAYFTCYVDCISRLDRLYKIFFDLNIDDSMIQDTWIDLDKVKFDDYEKI